MHFDGDAFISYAHLDNQELVEGRKGWVANLHRALEIRVGQLLGKEPHIWRDPKLQGNDFFAETLIERLKRVAVLVAVVSPRYIRSEWTRRELVEFWKAAEQQGGVHLNHKARIFKVLKTPIPLGSHPPELQSLLGYEFFKIDPETGRVRELDEVFGADAQRDFWIKLDDLAHEICGLLEGLESSQHGAEPSAQRERQAVYLAETTTDLREQREMIRRDLQQHGYDVLPALPLPHVAADVKSAVRADLSRCCMSIHLFGQNFSVVPEGGVESLLEIQNEMAIEHARDGRFFRLLWIPQGVALTDDRQRTLIERLRNDSRLEPGADLLETYFEDLRTLIHQRLEAARTPAPAEQPPAPSDAPVAPAGTPAPSVYLVYDRRDASLVAECADLLFEQHLEILHPAFEGDEADVREYHEENLRTCDGVLVFHGAAGEMWVRRKLRELQKSAGYGRVKPGPTVAICPLPPRTPEKERFRTHEAIVLPFSDTVAPESLAPFIARVRQSGEGRQA